MAEADLLRRDLGFVDLSLRSLSNDLATLETALEEAHVDEARAADFERRRDTILERVATLVEARDPAMAAALRARAGEATAWDDDATRRSLLDRDLALVAPAFERVAIGLGEADLRCDADRTLAALFVERVASEARIQAHLDGVELAWAAENGERPSRAVLARGRADRELADTLGALSSAFSADARGTSERLLALPTPESGQVVGAWLAMDASLGLARAACRWNDAAPPSGSAP